MNVVKMYEEIESSLKRSLRKAFWRAALEDSILLLREFTSLRLRPSMLNKRRKLIYGEQQVLQLGILAHTIGYIEFERLFKNRTPTTLEIEDYVKRSVVYIYALSQGREIDPTIYEESWSKITRKYRYIASRTAYRYLRAIYNPLVDILTASDSELQRDYNLIPKAIETFWRERWYKAHVAHLASSIKRHLTTSYIAVHDAGISRNQLIKDMKYFLSPYLSYDSSVVNRVIDVHGPQGTGFIVEIGDHYYRSFAPLKKDKEPSTIEEWILRLSVDKIIKVFPIITRNVLFKSIPPRLLKPNLLQSLSSYLITFDAGDLQLFINPMYRDRIKIFGDVIRNNEAYRRMLEQFEDIIDRWIGQGLNIERLYRMLNDLVNNEEYMVELDKVTSPEHWVCSALARAGLLEVILSREGYIYKIKDRRAKDVIKTYMILTQIPPQLK